jgi:hypothetical protein
MRSQLFVGALLLLCARSVSAQQTPPVHGVTGTIALKGNVDKIYDGAHKIIVKTEDGVQHVVNVTKGTKVHGTAGDSMDGLHEGTSVVVHYSTDGAEMSAEEIDDIGATGLKVTEGVVTRVDRSAKTITLRLPDGATQLLYLSDRAAADDGKEMTAGRETGTSVIVYYMKDGDRQVAHFFKKKS